MGRSGMFGHLIDTYGAVELDRVRRFANDWESDASLHLLLGDTEVLPLDGRFRTTLAPQALEEQGPVHGRRLNLTL